jgi:hypothetical protein
LASFGRLRSSYAQITLNIGQIKRVYQSYCDNSVMDKLVRIKDSTYNELTKRGKWNDTMDSIIQRLLCQQQNNHGIDDTPKKSEREERQRKKMMVRDSDEGKNVLQGALQVGSQKRQAVISSQAAEWDGEDTKYG